MRKIVKGRLEYMIKAYEKIRFVVDNHQTTNMRNLAIGSGLDNEDLKVIMAVLNLKRPPRLYPKKKKENTQEEKKPIVRPPAIYDNRQFV